MIPGSKTGRTWRVSQHICSYHDSERHLGHVVKTDKWHAFDATHLSPEQDGIRYLGSFADLDAARAAVEASAASRQELAPIPAWIF